MKERQPTSTQWKALYKAAAEFREIEPWKWVKETDLFGVRNPRTDEIGYCCVMGELGQVLGMAVYLGTGGLNAYCMIQNNDITHEDRDFMFVQDCILVSFENKSALNKEDKALIGKLGIRAKGKRAWPMFRRHEPGYFPWFLEGEDIQFLTLVLQEANEVCLRLKEGKELLHPPKKASYLVRAYHRDTNKWEDTWKVPEPLPKQAPQLVKPDELALQRIKKNIRPSPVAWEIDFFYIPAPVYQGGRPSYPYSIMIVDQESGFVHDVYVSERGKAPAEFINRLLECIEKTGIVPNQLLVKRQEAADLFSPIADKLEIRLHKVDKLLAVEEARRSMETHLLKERASQPLLDDYYGDDQMEEYLQSGSGLSIFGLYGLIYGCLAAPNVVMPSALMPAIFGKDGPTFETESQAYETVSGIMALWNYLNQWDSEKEGIILPDFEYPASKDGALQRNSDAIDLLNSFMNGLELAGLAHDRLPTDLKKDADQLGRVIDLLYSQIQLLEQANNLSGDEIKGAMRAIENAEFVIEGCITNIYLGLKDARLRAPEQIRKQTPQSTGVHLPSQGKVGRNDPCPCGSGKKFKKCCGLN